MFLHFIAAVNIDFGDLTYTLAGIPDPVEIKSKCGNSLLVYTIAITFTHFTWVKILFSTSSTNKAWNRIEGWLWLMFL